MAGNTPVHNPNPSPSPCLCLLLLCQDFPRSRVNAPKPQNPEQSIRQLLKMQQSSENELTEFVKQTWSDMIKTQPSTEQFLQLSKVKSLGNSFKAFFNERLVRRV